MSTVRTQHFHQGAENPSRSSVKSATKAQGQKTGRKALADLSNASLASKASKTATASMKSYQKQDTSKRKKSRLNASKDIDFNAEKEYMPKSDKVNNLAFETEFVPSSYFKDLITALKSTPYPLLSGLDLPDKEPYLPSLTLDTETRPDDSNYEYVTEEFAELPPLDLPLSDMPDIPDFP